MKFPSREITTRASDVDFKAEVLAAELVAADVPLNKIIINPLGPAERSFSPDLAAIREVLLEPPPTTYFFLDTPREGLFDGLPQKLFFGRTFRGRDDQRDADDIVNQIRIHRQEENQARRFFLPLDAELHRLRILGALSESILDRKEDSSVLIRQFAPYWPILNELDVFHANLFIHILPLVHLIRNNLNWLGRFLELLVEVPVQVEIGRDQERVVKAGFGSTLGKCQLGIDAIAGQSFDDGSNSLRITLGPVPASQTERFLPHTHTIHLLDLLGDYFVPASSDVTTIIKTQRPDYPTRLPHPDVILSPVPYLGYSSFL